MTFCMTTSSAYISPVQSITENRFEFMYCRRAESSDGANWEIAALEEPSSRSSEDKSI